jgi:hypothetical protein
MRVKVELIGQGLHPRETVVKINTNRGPQELSVDSQSLQNGTIEIGYPIAHQGRYVLIELPTETSGGLWRVWVDKENLMTLEAAE